MNLVPLYITKYPTLGKTKNVQVTQTKVHIYVGMNTSQLTELFIKALRHNTVI